MVRPSDNPYAINVGRRGITDGLIVEIARQLEKRGDVVVKLLKAYTDELERDEIDACFSTIEQLAGEVAIGTVTSEKRRGYTKRFRLERAERKPRDSHPSAPR